jgi:mannitol-1-phosphate 5-dehydrogenase
MKQAVIFGAGNIGRGFIGQLYSESGFDVTFVDVEEKLIAALRERGSYTIQLVDNESSREVQVAPVHALHSVRDADEVAKTLSKARIGATAVGARILPLIAPLVAAGIGRRAAARLDEPLNLIICENLKDAAAQFRGMVAEHLTEPERQYAQDHIGFVDTVIGRMVPPPTPEMVQTDPSLILVEPYRELPVDRSGFIGDIPDISGMDACDNFPAYTARKLYIHNCGHAVLAYLGYLKGHQYGYEALVDPQVRPVVERALAESIQGIVHEYGVSPEWLQAHVNDLLHRFANRALGDTIFRLGRDPVRKLAPTDRLIGAARLVEKAGIQPDALSWGIAAAFCFDPAGDHVAVSLQDKIRADGLDSTLQSVSQVNPEEPLAQLVRSRFTHLRESKTAELF